MKVKVGCEGRPMKPSGVAWIGDVPEGWKTCRIASLYELRNTKCSDKDFAPLSVTMKGVLPQLEQVAKTNNGEDRKLVLAGDFVINSRSDRRGACGISDLDGSVSVINTVLKPREKMNASYYSWVFRSTGFADEFYAWGHGIVDDLWTTRWSDMKNILVMVPPLPEQQAIADYLDRECGKIDELRAKIEAQIADLATYKKSVITEAVTGNCKIENGECKMRPRTELRHSGVEWIGEVPEGWKVRRFKYIFHEITDGSHFSPQGVDEGYPYITATDVRGVGIDYSSTIKISKSSYDALVSSGCKVQRGDVLVVKDGATTGRVGLMIDNVECVALSSVAMLRSSRNAEKFLMYQVMSSLVQDQIRYSMAGAAMPRTTISKLREYVGVEPTLSEQREIVDYLDKKCGAIDAAVAKCRAQLEDLATYKKSLIYECVTGKKSVFADEPLRRGKEAS